MAFRSVQIYPHRVMGSERDERIYTFYALRFAIMYDSNHSLSLSIAPKHMLAFYILMLVFCWILSVQVFLLFSDKTTSSKLGNEKTTALLFERRITMVYVNVMCVCVCVYVLPCECFWAKKPFLVLYCCVCKEWVLCVCVSQLRLTLKKCASCWRIRTFVK